MLWRRRRKLLSNLFFVTCFRVLFRHSGSIRDGNLGFIKIRPVVLKHRSSAESWKLTVFSVLVLHEGTFCCTYRMQRKWVSFSCKIQMCADLLKEDEGCECWSWHFPKTSWQHFSLIYRPVLQKLLHCEGTVYLLCTVSIDVPGFNCVELLFLRNR